MQIRLSVVVLAMLLALLAACTGQGSGRGSAAMATMPGHGQMGMHAMAGASPVQLAQMDERLRAMQDAHAKMMSAKTPDERRALMAGHHSVMMQMTAETPEAPAPAPK